MNPDEIQTLFLMDDAPEAAAARDMHGLTLCRGVIEGLDLDGTVRVSIAGSVILCEVLITETTLATALAPGNSVLVAASSTGSGQNSGIVLGRIGKYRPPEPAKPEPHVTVEATETLTLKCGEASVDLRKDGKVMVRGEDVLLRAKKTQRIKAGTVAIN